MSGTCDEASHQSDFEAPSNSADAELSSANLEWLEGSYPPQYVFANPDAKLPSYLGSVLQPETSSEAQILLYDPSHHTSRYQNPSHSITQ
ncbi:hypothetical protein H4Q26_001989 [Puccinia striiformis f. sp. tritici PST-130]|nr:hypothetical protein H4Q26_001989 [Puccinia striiformis f. sp. tritici PST-130]